MRIRDDANTLLLKTYGEVIGDGLIGGFQRKRLAASGAGPTIERPAVGLTIPRPVHIEKIRYCGKEVTVDTSEAPIEEGLTAEELDATSTLEYKLLASQEAQHLLAEGVDVADAAQRAGVHRTTVWRIRNGRRPREKTARRLLGAGLREQAIGNLVDDNTLRDLVRAHGIERTAQLSYLDRRSVYRILAGQKPHNSTVERSIDATKRALRSPRPPISICR